MKNYVTDFFRYAGCALHNDGNVLTVELSPELAPHFGKPTLRLVFQPEHLEPQTELVTHGSYLANRLHDLLKATGVKMSVLLPKCVNAEEYLQTSAQHPTAVSKLLPRGINCTLTPHHPKEIRQTESYLIFRLTYSSDEKVEEILTARSDFAGNIQIMPEFPYPCRVLQDAASSRFPFTRRQMKVIYDHCLRQVESYAAQQAQTHQGKLAQHFHANAARLEAYYHQMIDEVPALENNRELAIHQLQEEYELKIADEVKKCQLHVAITPVSFCAMTIPFRQYRYTLETNGMTGQAQTMPGKKTKTRPSAAEARINVYHNLFSGEVVYPRCTSCGHDLKQIGVCELTAHPVCHNCLVECHVCGAQICKNCGITVCFECGEWVCEACSEQCHLCGERSCAQHLLGCVSCREHFCPQCAESCEVCGKPAEKTHLTTCAVSQQRACPACIGVCSCCRKEVCQEYLHACAFCGQQACAECTFQCDVCGEAFCVQHISECEITQQTICPRHAGTCERCGRHVSLTSLAQCDVCGKKVCPRCATRCARCQTVFCQEDTGDMLICPECGQTYCALCYAEHNRSAYSELQ